MKTTASNPQPSARSINTSFHQLAFLLNFIIGHRCPDLSLAEVRAAARDDHLLALLVARYGHEVDFYYLIHKPSILEQLEAALSDAAKNLRWGESSRIGISSSGLCLALAIVLEAVQQQFHHPAPARQTGASNRI
ncbi:MAG TPA: hypothetical protein VN578_14665 [Candidatus Binatia bacterium]|nr:hypothetical protein [Candidatus Binatia bacterium]